MPNWPRVCFQMIVHNQDYVLREAIAAIRPYGPIIVTEGPVGYWRTARAEPDETNFILDALRLPVLRGEWAEKDEMVNAGIERVPEGTEFIWVIDSDEVWRARDIEAILKILAGGQVDSMAFHAYSYYGGFTRVMGGFEESFEVHRIQRWYPGARWATHRPPTILAPDGRPWRQHRHMTGNECDNLGLRYWHYSYLWPRQMEAKARYYKALDGGAGTIPEYFERVYKPWVAADRAGDVALRQAIEDYYEGVHNWIPPRRGPAFTREAALVGHPAIVEGVMGRLLARFDVEWKAL